jgi:hypothetical protein
MRLLIGVCAIAGAAIAAAPASATTIINYVHSGSDTITFGQSNTYFKGFGAVYRFDLPKADYVDFIISSLATPLKDVNLKSVLFNGTPLTRVSSGVLDLWTLNDKFASAGRNYLTISGYWGAQGGSYTGKFTYGAAASVPEPAAWAMMIAGFGLVGGALRRRSTMKVSYS